MYISLNKDGGEPGADEKINCKVKNRITGRKLDCKDKGQQTKMIKVCYERQRDRWGEEAEKSSLQNQC